MNGARRIWSKLAARSRIRPLSDQIEIDRARLWQQTPEYRGQFSTPLQQEIHRALSIFGPMSIANYMKRALLHPTMGYYSNKDAFGTKGDFTTSPEISQLFGEMIGIWMMTVLEALSRPDRISLVELGPGRGTMMSDIIRTLMKLGVTVTDIHLIEQSSFLRQIQAQTLDPLLRGCPTRVHWHHDLSSFDPQPDEAILFVAQEFLDALPIHQFQYTTQGWRERLVAANLRPDAAHPLQVVLAPQPTPACQLIDRGRRRPTSPRVGDILEISPESVAIVDRICARLAVDRGAALIVDYGSERPDGDTLRAVDSHQFVPFLERPGRVDVTADVDFGALRHAVKDWEGSGLRATPIIEQGRFLTAMGIMERVQGLVDQCKSEQDEDVIITGYERLVDPEQMGAIYKCMAIVSDHIYDQIPGFASSDSSPE